MLTQEREEEIRKLSKWYSYDPRRGYAAHDSAYDAMSEAEAVLDSERDRASEDGWSELVEEVEWGRLLPVRASAQTSREPAPDGSPFDELADYGLVVDHGDVVAELLSEIDRLRADRECKIEQDVRNAPRGKMKIDETIDEAIQNSRMLQRGVSICPRTQADFDALETELIKKCDSFSSFAEDCELLRTWEFCGRGWVVHLRQPETQPSPE